jgi:hypothetical protein
MYLTRNQAYGFPVPWVRIPPSPPDTRQKPRIVNDLRGFRFLAPQNDPRRERSLRLASLGPSGIKTVKERKQHEMFVFPSPRGRYCPI